MRGQGGQVGCLLSTLGLVIGVPLLLLGVRVAANAGEADARRVGKKQIVQARQDAVAQRNELLRPLQDKLQSAHEETNRASRALSPLQSAAGHRTRRLAALALRFAQLPEGAGLTLPAVQRASSLDEAIAFTLSAKLSDSGQTQPRQGAAPSPYPAGTPANAKLQALYREHGFTPRSERGRLSGELRGMRERRVSGVLAACAPLAEGTDRGVTLTLSDQLSPRARELLLERFKRLSRLVDSGWIKAWFLKKVSHSELLPISEKSLASALASEFSAPGPLRSPEEIQALYADRFSYEFENESPQTIEIKLAGETLELAPYLWATVILTPGSHVGICRSLKDEHVTPLSFEVEGSAGDRHTTRLEISRSDVPREADDPRKRK